MTLKPLELWRADNQAREAFATIADSRQFRLALSAALASMQASVCNDTNAGAMLRGANQLSDILLTMGNVPRGTESVSFDLPNPEALEPKRK